MTESPPLLSERFLDFTLTVEWEFKNNASAPAGYFKILYPFCFPKYIEPSIIPITEEQTSESVTVNCCIDEFFIDAAFRNPFTFTLQYSRDPPETNPETFVPTKLLMDGSPLFLPDCTEAMISIEDTEIFSKITFSMYCESQLLTDECYSIFAPCFIHLTEITNIPPSTSDEAPLFYICKVKNIDYNILSHGPYIDTVIPVEYRDQDTVTFQVRNHEKYFPSNVIGSGAIFPYNGNSQPSLNYGIATFDLLPERKKRAQIEPPSENPNSNKSDFKSNNYQLIYHIIDPSSAIDPIPADRGPIPRPAVEKMKPVTDEFPDDGRETEASVLAREKENTKLNRWVFTCSRSDGTWSYATKILHYVQSYHKHIGKLQSPPPLAPIISSTLPDSSLPPNLRNLSNNANIDEQNEIRKYAFERFYRKSKDVITGVQIMTPSEQIIILETRAQEPMGSTKGLEHLLRSFDPAIAHVLANRSLIFKPARLYCLFDNAISKVSLPLSMSDLLRIEGLYFPKSPNYKFYPILTKLSHIFESNTLAEMSEGDLFPNREELMFLLSMAGVFYTIPFQKGMPPMSMSSSHGPVKANFGNVPEPTNRSVRATRPVKATPPSTSSTRLSSTKSGKNSQKMSKKEGNKNKNKNSTTSLSNVNQNETNNDTTKSEEEVANESNKIEEEKKSQVKIREYPQFDIPEGLLFSVKRNSMSKSSIITPIDHLTNYSLTMTQNQKQIYKTRHARIQRIKREVEWYEAVEDFNKSQVRMSQTYDEKQLNYNRENGNGFELNIGLIPINPPSTALAKTASPRRIANSQRLNSFPPKEQKNPLQETI